MDKLNEPLKIYFKCSTKLFDKWPKFRSCCLKSVSRIQNLSEQYQLVKRTKLVLPSGEDPVEMEDKLLIYMRMQLIQEVEEFNSFRRAMEVEVYALERLQSKIDKMTEDLPTEGIPTNPLPYHLLLEQMHISFRYFQGSYAKINAAFNMLDYEDEETITSLKETVADEEIPPDSIKKMLWFTHKYFDNS